jgi:hypothetical protein
MATSSPLVNDAPPIPGGTVEPTRRAAVAKDLFQTPEPPPAERFELRDPFSEVTYTARSLPEMGGKAEQLGARRFVAIDIQGRRGFVEKVEGEWVRRPVEQAEMSKPAAEAIPAGPGTDTPKLPKSPRPEVQIDVRAERDAMRLLLQSALQERYLIRKAPLAVGDLSVGRTEYRFRGDSSRVAFTESTFRLATDTNSPSVARSMIDVAQARNWSAVRVSGHEDFKRLVWMEASVRGVKAVGYEPNAADLEVLRRDREARLVNRIESARDAGSATATAVTYKAWSRGSGGRKAVLAAVEAVLIEKNVPEKQRAAVMAAATEKLAQHIRGRQSPNVDPYVKNAPNQRPVMSRMDELQRSHHHSAPGPAR